MTKESIQERIAELDQQACELAELLSNTTDEQERERLSEEAIAVALETNRLLRAIGADPSEMYDI